MRYGLLFIALLVPACGSRPAVVSETWQAAYLEGARIGHTHTLVTRVGDNLRTVRTVKLTVKRYGSVLPIEIEQTCEETPDGKVLTLGLDQSIGKDKQSAMTARVEGKKLRIKTGTSEESRAWDDDCLGLYAQEQAFARKKAKAGDKFALSSFELSAELPLTLRVEVKGEEKVERLVMAGDGVKREPTKLLRADITTDKVFIKGAEVQLPPKTVWLDGEGQVVREQFEFPGLGLVTQFTTTREAARKEGILPDLLPDLGTNIMIPLNKDIDRPYDTSKVNYRVTVDAPGKPPFVKDDRQEIQLPLGKSFELWVRSVRGPGDKDKAPPPGKEFTESNRFIDSDDAVIQALAKKIVGDEKRPFEAALKLEKWVHEQMTFDAGVGFPPASQTAVDLKGDCRQHALLLAALMRASGIPARTALGLIYTRDPGKGPMFAFHMWTEAWLGGRWVALDAIQGKGFVGATHLTMVQHSWAGTQTLAPLLPIAGVLGKLKIEVIEAR